MQKSQPVGFSEMAVHPQFHHEIRSDARDYEALLAGPWELEYRQMSCGAFTATNTGVTIGDSVVYQETFNRAVTVYGALGPGMIGFSLPNKLAQQRGRWWGADFPGSAISFATGKREIDVALPEGYRNLLVLLPEEAFRSYYSDLLGEEPVFLDQSSPHLIVQPSSFSECRMALKNLISAPENPLTPADAIFAIMARALASRPQRHAGGSGGATLRHKSQIVRRAIELWQASRCKLPIAELSRQVDVSQRSLEYSFRERFDLTPHQYLSRCRLRLARDALLTANDEQDSVTEIAMRYGFSELGRFAGKYKEFYGELPSDTLARKASPLSAPLFTQGCHAAEEARFSKQK